MADQRLVDLIKRFREEAVGLMGDYDHLTVYLTTRCGRVESCKVNIGGPSYLRFVGVPENLERVAKDEYGYRHVEVTVEDIKFGTCLTDEDEA